jgi:hypothetical protein
MINIKYVNYKYPVEVAPMFLQKQKHTQLYSDLDNINFLPNLKQYFHDEYAK